jgi:hypothetical protein
LTPLLWFAVPGLWLLCREPATRAAGVVCSALFVLSTLAIASMNNWRGGWTIGPRYLAVCMPFLAFAALHALSWLHRRAPLWAAGLALGAAAASCVASGVPSAYYPHLPPEFTRPLPQLFRMLIAHDFAPTNLGNWLGLWGTASMLPLLGCAAGTLLIGLAAVPANRLACAAIALVSCLLWITPLWLRPSEEPGVRQGVAFVTGRFHPAGHDRASRLHTQLLAAGQSADPAAWQRLRQLYLSEGRDKEAQHAAARR